MENLFLSIIKSQYIHCSSPLNRFFCGYKKKENPVQYLKLCLRGGSSGEGNLFSLSCSLSVPHSRSGLFTYIL